MMLSSGVGYAEILDLDDSVVDKFIKGDYASVGFNVGFGERLDDVFMSMCRLETASGRSVASRLSASAVTGAGTAITNSQPGTASYSVPSTELRSAMKGGR